MRIFLYKLAVAILPVVILAGLNYSVDPHRVFTAEDYLRPAADAMVRGDHILGLGDCDERMLQKMIVEATPSHPECLVLGSSRILSFRTGSWGEASFRNHGVSGASLHDLMAVSEIYAQRKYRPRRLVIGVDPWIFNRHLTSSRWQTLLPECVSMCDRIGIPPSKIGADKSPGKLWEAKFLNLVDIRTGVDSFQRLFKGAGAERSSQAVDYQIVSQIAPDQTARLSDGSVHYDQNGETSEKGIPKLRFYNLEGFVEIDPDRWQTFIHWIEWLNTPQRPDEPASEIVLVFMPYHPYVYQAMKQSCPVVMEVESMVRRQFASLEHLHVVGSYDPRVWGMNDNDFYDAIHPSHPVVNAQLAKRWPRWTNSGADADAIISMKQSTSIR